MKFYKWGRQPYTYDSRPYYKVESTTKLMPREIFEERIRANKPQYYAWERQKADKVTIGDLNEERIRGAIRLGVERGRMMASAMTEPFEKALNKLQLLNDGVPNNAAAVLFSTNICGYTQFRLRMARFRGTVRKEHLEIPTEALRETLVNALCHRQYEKYNLTIGIAIYDNCIEIENPGILPPQLTPETIKQPHISYPYNPIIADVLFKTTFLENWGSGAARIVDACKQQNVEEPVWRTQGGFVIVTFKRPSKDADAVEVKAGLSPACH